MNGKVKGTAEQVGMLNPDTGHLKGYIPQDFNIWVPPKKITYDGQQIDAVKIIESEDEARLTFLVPRNWVRNNDGAELIVEELKALYNDDPKWEKELIKKVRVNKNLPPYGGTAFKKIGWTRKETTTGLLDEFIELVSLANTKGIKKSYFAFAKKWGPLWIPHKLGNAQFEADNYYKDLPFAPWVESIEVWAGYALKIKTALLIAILLNRGDPVVAEMWHDLHGSTDPGYSVPENVEEQRKWFEIFFNMQTAIDYDVSYFLDWSNDKPKIGLRANTGFLSAGWFQLLQAVTMQTLTMCDGCGKAYDREKRKPKKGQNNYCKDCRKTAPKNDWYHRNKDIINEQRRQKKV